MKLEVSVTEAVQLIKEIQQPGKILEMVKRMYPKSLRII